MANSLPSLHPIRIALEKTKASKELIKEFSGFLTTFSHCEEQALYLLEDKKIKIEKIVEEMYDVPVKKQPNWKKQSDHTSESFEVSNFEEEFDNEENTGNKKLLFKDWKQEHGFESIPPEVGDIHTFIRFKKIVTAEQEEKFLWQFNRSRFGKRGWGHEKPIKSLLSSLLDNNNNPGWVVKNFLEENLLVRDSENKITPLGEVSNPMLLTSRDTHSLLFLLLGHPFLFYDDNKENIKNGKTNVEFEVLVYNLESHHVVCGHFFSLENKKRKEIITEDFLENGFILHGLPKAIVYKNKYYKIGETVFPAKMISESFKGALVPNDDWDKFSQTWNKFYPKKQLVHLDPKENEVPNFSARTIKDWKYWLTQPEYQVKLFEDEVDSVRVYLKENDKNSIAEDLYIDIKNLDNPKSKLLAAEKRPKATKLLGLLGKIKENIKRQELFYPIGQHTASQLCILSEEYPYSFSYNQEPMIHKGHCEYVLTIKKNPGNLNQYLLQGSLKRRNSRNKLIPIFKKKTFAKKAIGMVPSFIFYKDQLLRISSMMSGRLVNDTLNGVIVEEKEISDFYATALTYLQARDINIHDPQGLLRVSALYNYILQGHMTIWEAGGILMGRLSVSMITDVGDFEYAIDSNMDEFYQRLDNQKLQIPRNRFMEQKLREAIYEDGWVEEGNNEFSMNDTNAMEFVLEILPNQEENHLIQYFGMKKLKRWKTKKIQPIMFSNIKTGINWFGLDLKMEYQGNELELKEIVDIWRQDRKAIELPKSEGIAVIDKDWISKYAPILNRIIQSSNKIDDNNRSKTVEKEVEKIDERNATLKVEKFQIGLLNEIENAALESYRDKKWSALIEDLHHFTGIKKQKIPSEIKATLRDYQKDGVNWLCFLREYGFGGILADDMGLGKTLQALTFLRIAKKKNWQKYPNLVIAPTSVVTNWRAEAEKFIPDFNCVLLHGSKRKYLVEEAKNCDLIITTYGLLQRDLELLTSLRYSTLILDEAQMIKNTRSKTAAAVSQLTAEHRVTLTGTPIENSVSELWSQFNFLMPGFMGSIQEFQKNYIKPTIKKNVKRRPDYGLLRRQTKPFIMRRMKQHVARELPPKTEQTLYCEMNDRQRKLYESVMQIVRKQIENKLELHGAQGARIAVFDALLKLRQICCDPRLSTLAGDKPPVSAKMNLFVDTISAIVEEGHRVLVFSQFVKMLNLMHDPLNQRSVPFLQLDGSTQNRDTVVAKFQEGDNYPVFLISLKAGGTGINLTAADYVIHYDPWWNPAVENQATDRAYRIGQKNHLHVYRLITRNSIEEKILDLQSKKSAIAQKIIGISEGLESMINLDDIQEFFSLS